ncbi:HAMP domain-containing sensor histidine kinase [Enorma massiliensis]|uniref:HAMP domain-containing sensor histidine kinase n=1 Tax=Enorma massiliensis TaxID=1472761 RepID=UPI0002EE43C9|nr:HAMP domain-containing histidine kinase [Enorma massiliensis]
MSGKHDDRLREQCHAEQATASAAGDSQRGGRLRRLRDRLRAWWRNPSIMRAFFVYALVWLVAASVVTLIAIDALMEVYYRVSEEHRSEHVEVNAGPYIYDAQTNELLRATPVYLQDFYEQVVFVAFTNSAQNYSSAGVVAGGWNRDMQVVDATMELLRSDPSYRVSDWGGNYTEDDYLQTDGTPYDPEATVSVSDLPAYDARERAERLQTVEEFANTNLGEDVVLSNVAYYVSLDEASYLTWIDWTLRLVAGVGVPIVAFGGLAVLLFRRFYRRHIGGPLSVLEAAADRIARQDLDFQIGAVRGRELGRLGAAMEGMRSSLLATQRELWRTAEDRRRLNAAFAHDLRTPVTVLKGTLEMARIKADRAGSGEDVRKTLDTLSGQADRLESYAQLMSRVTKLEDREVMRSACAPSDVACVLERQAAGYVATRGNGCKLLFSLGDGMRAAGAGDGGAAAPDAGSAAGVGVEHAAGPCLEHAAVPDAEHAAEPCPELLSIDMQLVEEVLGNLLGNACDHARSKVAVSVDLLQPKQGSLAAGARGDVCLELVVTDDGRGFTAEALHHGCDPFYSEAKSAEHFGLGLNIARTLARLHGGAVELGNLEGGGACVTATFAVDTNEENR